jgi:DNA topoisomerase-1
MIATRIRRRSPRVKQGPALAAKAAGLRYVSDGAPRIRRVRAGKGFHYADHNGQPVREPETLARIKALVIPPAWTDVWICADPQGHIQATGRDDRGRKQYRYHARWRATRDDAKYGRTIAFGRALHRIREKTERDLASPRLSRRNVLPTIVRLLETTFIRVGNDEYVRQNHSYGLTTLEDRHVAVDGPKLRFRFQGKSGKRHEFELNDRRLARVVHACQELPGQELFQYVDDEGLCRSIDLRDVNDYLREISGQDFTAKDFRTWAGTVLASLALQEFESFDSAAQAKKNIVRAIETVAARLGNTPSVCRKCYVHPAVIESYLDGTLLEALKRRTDQELDGPFQHLRAEEAAVHVLLQRRLAEETREGKHAQKSR